ncbi:MAG: SDR family oxidoreductase, partial [Candidatus Dormibacteraceae bacterium]
MRALVTGAGGGLGTQLMGLLPGAAGFDRRGLSVADEDAVLRTLTQVRPEVVFNCAAYNAVDGAEGDEAAAMAVNERGARGVARACAAVGARLVHFSTNYVFDGLRPGGYAEGDRPSPLGVYGRSKLLGERAVLELLPEALVIRSSGLYGPGG